MTNEKLYSELVELKEQQQAINKRFFDLVSSVKSDYYKNRRLLNDLRHMIELGEELSIKDKNMLFEVYQYALKERRELKNTLLTFMSAQEFKEMDNNIEKEKPKVLKEFADQNRGLTILLGQVSKKVASIKDTGKSYLLRSLKDNTGIYDFIKAIPRYDVKFEGVLSDAYEDKKKYDKVLKECQSRR